MNIDEINIKNGEKQLTTDKNEVKKGAGRPRKMTTVEKISQRDKKMSGTKRVPLAQQKRYPEMPREGFHRCWRNDENGKIEMCLKAGYTHVQADIDPNTRQTKDSSQIGNSVSIPVGQGRNGPTTAYLMEIPQELYDEDEQTEQDKITKNMQSFSIEKTNFGNDAVFQSRLKASDGKSNDTIRAYKGDKVNTKDFAGTQWDDE